MLKLRNCEKVGRDRSLLEWNGVLIGQMGSLLSNKGIQILNMSIYNFFVVLW